MDRFHVAIVTVGICSLQFLGARPTFAQEHARPFNDSETGRLTRGSVDNRESSALQAFGRVPLAFVENSGQFDERVCFATRRGGMRA